MTERVVAATIAVEPGPDRPTDIHVVGIPRRQGAALALITYYPQAVWKRYSPQAQANVLFHLSWEPIGTVVAQLAAQPCNRDYRVYSWNAEAQRLDRHASITAAQCAERRALPDPLVQPSAK